MPQTSARFMTLRLMRLVLVVPDADFRLSDLSHAQSPKLRKIVDKLTAHQCVALVSKGQDQVMFIYGAHEVAGRMYRSRTILASGRVRVTDRTRFDWRMWQQYAEEAGIQLEGVKAFREALEG